MTTSEEFLRSDLKVMTRVLRLSAKLLKQCREDTEIGRATYNGNPFLASLADSVRDMESEITAVIEQRGVN